MIPIRGLRAPVAPPPPAPKPAPRVTHDRRGFRWTADLDDRLRQLWAQEKTSGAIAAELGHGINRNGVIGRANRIGLPRRGNPIASPEARHG